MYNKPVLCTSVLLQSTIAFEKCKANQFDIYGLMQTCTCFLYENYSEIILHVVNC